MTIRLWDVERGGLSIVVNLCLRVSFLKTNNLTVGFLCAFRNDVEYGGERIPGSYLSLQLQWKHDRLFHGSSYGQAL